MHYLLSKYLLYYPATTLKGEHIAKYLKLYKKLQHAPKETIQTHQVTSLRKLITYAYNHSAYYKNLFDNNRVSPCDIHSLDDLKLLPILDKEELINNTNTIITRRSRFFTSTKTTGGSTGQAVTILKDSNALARERAATWRAYQWADIDIGFPQARFWGTPLYTKKRLEAKVIDLIANRIRLSAFEIDTDRLNRFHQKVMQYQPAYFYGYASVLETFARYVKDNNLCIPKSVKCVITTSEVLTETTRHLIQSAFGIPVYNEYGCGEVGSIAHECEHGSMHTMDENLIVEIIPDSTQEHVGEVVVTDLFNYTTPLIRYRLGDFASTTSKSCSCGRTLGVIKGIHGRAYDAIVTGDGVSHHPELIMYIFENIKEKHGGIDQFQVIQTAFDQLTIRLVKSRNYNVKLEGIISNDLVRTLKQKINIKFEYTDAIRRETSGKIRLVKSEINTQ